VPITGDWDQRITRRTLLRTGGSFAAGITLAGTLAARASAQASFTGNPFALGVASGDPTAHGVVLWTRIAPEPLVPGGGLPAEPYRVRYELARDEDFRLIVRHGDVLAVPDEAHSARVELDMLPPQHEYFYRFEVGGVISPVGRTRTGPPANAAHPAPLQFAFVSCQNYPDGYFASYAEIAAASDIETVIFLGDYIYEGPRAALRAHVPAVEITRLDEYRIRHAQYKTDADLQAAHAAHPWLVTWDDHEFDNDYAGMDVDPNRTPEVVAARRAAAYQAYWEHMPLSRARKPVGPDLQLYRRFKWGSIATFNVLDGRQYRSDQPDCRVATPRDTDGYCQGAKAPERTMLGAEQRDWLMTELATTRSHWNVIAQQTAFAPFERSLGAGPLNMGEGDNWDGYVAERQLLLDWMVEQRTTNPVVLTGDSHQSWVRNVPPDIHRFDAPPVATELMGTSVSSNGDPESALTVIGPLAGNPHILLRDNRRGYVRCSLTREAWTSEFRLVPTKARGLPASTLATAVIENGRAGAVVAGA
jgi:alkaline phosphatase D